MMFLSSSYKCLVALLCTWLVLSPAVLAASNKCASSLDLTSENGVLMANGERFYLKGLNWFGFETDQNMPHGLWGNTLAKLLDFVKNNNFNAIRMPFHMELFTQTKYPGSVGPNSNMAGMSSLQVMDLIISEAGKRGIVIMLDLHSFTPDSFMAENMWYTSRYSEAQVLNMWTTIVARYKNTWNLVAFDLKNEPYGCTWGTGNMATDWNAAASRIGTHIQNLDGGSRFLIFVEGVSSSPPCADACFWGENLKGVTTHPVSIPNMKKLVYSPHTYGPDVSAQAYFSASNFPANMPAIWNDHYGFVPSTTGHAIVIGEWGGHYSGGSNNIWMDSLVTYLLAKGTTDTFYWCLNPNSGDTGGLLGEDWTTPQTGKLALNARLVPNPSIPSATNGQICVSNTAPGTGGVVSSAAAVVTTAAAAVTTAVSGGGGGGTPPRPSSTTTTGQAINPAATTGQPTNPVTSSVSSADSGSSSCASMTISTSIRSSWTDGAGTHGIYDIVLANAGSSSASNVPFTITVSSGATIEQIWNMESAGGNKYTISSVGAQNSYNGAGFIAGGSSPVVRLVCASASGSGSPAAAAASTTSGRAAVTTAAAASTSGRAVVTTAASASAATTGAARATTATTGAAAATTTGRPASTTSSSSSSGSSTSTSTTCRAGISFALSNSWNGGGQVSITISNTGTQPIKTLRVSLPGVSAGSAWNVLADNAGGFTLPTWSFPLAAGAKFTSAGYTYVGPQPTAGSVLAVSC